MRDCAWRKSGSNLRLRGALRLRAVWILAKDPES